MSAESSKPKRKPGRPKSSNPKSALIALRLDRELVDGTETYRQRQSLDDQSSAIRHMMRRTLASEGIISDPVKATGKKSKDLLK